VLEALVAKNLVVRPAAVDGRTRLVLLETVADFARMRLAERREGYGVRERHCAYYLALAERAAPELERSDRPALMAELDRELHNLDAALSWALDRDAAVSALRLATALLDYWDLRGRREGARWLAAALALPDENVPASVRAAALGAYAWCLAESGTFDDAEAAALESLELARSIGDVAQAADSTTALAVALIGVDRLEDGYRCATQAERLAREADDESKLVWAMHMRALTAPTFSEALVLGEQAVAAHRRLGRDRGVAWLQSSLAHNALVHGDHSAAQRLAPQALRSADSLGDPYVLSFAYGNQGLVCLLTGDIEGASEAFAQQLRHAGRQQQDRMLYEAMNGLGCVASARGEDELAAQLIGAAEATGSYRHHPALLRQLDDRYLAPARGRSGERAWSAAHAAGAALTPGQAVDAARNAHRMLERG